LEPRHLPDPTRYGWRLLAAGHFSAFSIVSILVFVVREAALTNDSKSVLFFICGFCFGAVDNFANSLINVSLGCGCSCWQC